ncbi:LeoA/HP0731 family dynamin-like GTPase [Peribacillus alkalitolerans]|uniref:LeoA/HP0731 family dynamin-like GTPase n=1 Tax=Peribacillus alkalitolerans TaxID=1550385 RepID=UPI0013D128BF|nr:LeoA/HP0731 family dynamin-like GTPase [Peribacillus alkalitolerans]
MTITTFLDEKQTVLNKLIDLKKKLLEFDEMEIDMGDLISKIDQSMKNINDETFVIAMFGAFTDGKSTIIKSITQHSSIAISPEPTTDEVKFYHLDGHQFGKDFSIVDTPGLFSEHMLHTDKTKKYISEANVVIYTVDSVNPLKDSHHPTIKWLLEDLNKIESTIFVINKMDAVADLEDDEDFENHSQIKKEVVINTLKNFVPLKVNPKVICVAADPFEMGLDYWRQHEESYQELSRMGNLMQALDQFINDSKEELIYKSGMSVINDAIHHSIAELIQVRDQVQKNRELLHNQLEEIEGELELFEKEITQKHHNITEEIINIREDILSYISSANSLEDLRTKVSTKIGEEGYILNKKIEMVIEKHTESLMESQKQMIKNIEASIEFHEQLQGQLLKMGNKLGGKLVKALSGASTKAISQTILKVRDVAKLPIKFKPWGAVKWAKALKTFGAVLSIALDAISGIVDFVKEHKLEKARNELVKQLEELFKEFITSFTKGEYIATYFPVVEMKQTFRIDKQNVLDTYDQTLDKIEEHIKVLEQV